jgi:glycosyltransferase involved in cell wall biosynthesis
MEQVVQSLARHQYKLGMQVGVLTSDHGRDELPPEDEAFTVSRLKSVYVAHTPIIPGLLPRLFGLHRDSIIHLHISCAYTPETVWAYARLRRHPYLAHVHLDVLPCGWAGSLLGPYKRLLLSRVLRGATAVLVPTPDYRELISGKYRIPLERVVVIANATGHRIADAPRSAARIGQRRKLLFVGRLSAQKNIPLMLEALGHYVQKYGSDVSLSIVGEGELRSAVHSQIDRLALGNIATLRGALHGEALESAYEDADLLLLTSVNESFGLVLVEAMTKGLPIVSVDIPAVRNVVVNGVNGLLVESAPQAVANAIHMLLTDKTLYTEVSRNNLAKARDYDWSAVAAELSAIYARSVIQNRPDEPGRTRARRVRVSGRCKSGPR